MGLTIGRPQFPLLSRALTRALLLSLLGTLLVTTALFPVTFLALNHFIYQAPAMTTLPLPMALTDLAVSLLRLFLACGVALVLRRRLEASGGYAATDAGRGTVLFGYLLLLWCGYWLLGLDHDLASHIESLFAAVNLALTGPSGTKGPALVFLYESTAHGSLFAYLAGWGCLLLPAIKKQGATVGTN